MRFKIKVIPNAKHNKLVEVAGGLKVYLTAPAVEGKANKALIEFLAEHFNAKRSKFKLILGAKNREKVIEFLL